MNRTKNNMTYIGLLLFCCTFLCGCFFRDGPDQQASVDTNGPENAKNGLQDKYNREPQEYEEELKLYLAPYGTLLDEGVWETAYDLPPDTLFRFYLQVAYGMYFTTLDYAQIYGEDFDLQLIPEEFQERADGTIIFPETEVEAVILQYFDVDVDYLRSAAAYEEKEEGYSLQLFSMDQALLPSIEKVTQKEDLLYISFQLYGIKGNMKVNREERYIMIVRILDSGFHYQGLQPGLVAG